MTTFSQPSKNITTFANTQKVDSETWDNSLYTWDETPRTWDNPLTTFSQPSKNVTTFTQPTKL
jgi:hypothetical protein